MKHWTRGLASMAAGLLLLASGGLGPTGSVTISKAAGASAGATSTQTLRALACPSVTVCYAVGDQGTILATHDAGASWQRQTSRTRDQVIAIACPDVSACFALAGAMCSGPTPNSLLRTTDGGSTWTRKDFLLLQTCPAAGPSCPSVTTCYLFRYCTPRACSSVRFEGGNPELYRTTDGGDRWQDRGRTPDNKSRGDATQGIGVQSLACPTPTVCYAGGLDQLAASTDGGKRWTRRFIEVAPCPTAETYCHQLNLMTCPDQRTCYAGGTFDSISDTGPGGSYTAVVVATTDGFRTWRRSLIQSFHGIVALSCPTTTDCFALGGGYGPFPHNIGSINETGRFATTTDGGTTWRVRRIARYPFTALVCPSVSVCYAAGYLGRLMGSTDGGTTWRDLTPALFLSGTYGGKQPLHTYSPWLQATGPWKVTVDVFWGAERQGPGANPLGCLPSTKSGVTIYVRNVQGQTVAGPVKVKLRPQIFNLNSRGTSTIQVTGRLRLDVLSHCSTFSARIDGVQPTGG